MATGPIAPPPAAPPPGFILLAAGASRRLGQPKQLLPIEGEPLVVRAARAALAVPVWPVIVVLGANAPLIRPLLLPLPVLIAENPEWSEGMASSIRCGVATLESFSRSIDSVVIAACDQPAMTAEVLSRLIEAYRKAGRSICAARYRSRLGVPAVFDRRWFPSLATLSGDTGARGLLAEADARGDAAAIDLPELAHDIDEPGDYERARAWSLGNFR
jgi:molybdenum cofactor cytidylyltransferase